MKYVKYGICTQSVTPIRKEPEHTSEQSNQLLFGEYFNILENNEGWLLIENYTDKHQGWLDKDQILIISKTEFDIIVKSDHTYANDFIDFITESNDGSENITPIPIGSLLPLFNKNSFKINNNSYKYTGRTTEFRLKEKSNLIENAFMYLNSPYLWGGKSPLGIDSSGLSQIIYKLNGIILPRNANNQSKIGETLSFIEESEPGDLAFFDNEEGEIIHVGVMMENYNIIHSHGKVRIDKLDHIGIFNVDTKRHSHKLRVIKKIC